MKLPNDPSGPRWTPSADTARQVFTHRAREIAVHANNGRGDRAAEAEHEAIELIMKQLTQAVVYGASRAKVIELLDTTIEFCAMHFALEERYMCNADYGSLKQHTSAHKRLLAKFVKARRNALGEGISLATLDTISLLRAFHWHVRNHDRETHLALSHLQVSKSAQSDG